MKKEEMKLCVRGFDAGDEKAPAKTPGHYHFWITTIKSARLQPGTRLRSVTQKAFIIFKN
jgi:hypothetical protein